MTYINYILSWMPSVFKPQQKALIALLSALMCFRGRATMRNLSRYGAGSEKRLRRWASEKFDFLRFNLQTLHHSEALKLYEESRTIQDSPSQAILIDATFLRKSGRHTQGIKSFHNGSSRASNKIEKGLEMTLISGLNVEERSAYSISAHQSFNKSSLYVAIEELPRRAAELQEISKYIVADGLYAKKSFIDAMTLKGFEVVTLLRYDAHLRYLYEGEYLGVGRPRKYDEQVDYADLSKFECYDNMREEWTIYSKIVNYPRWKRELLIVIKINDQGQRRIFCSTDLSLSVEAVLDLYEGRFQIEFLFRDAKQHTGLGHAQVLDSAGQEHFANASFSTLNLLRLEDRQFALSQDIELRGRVGSIGFLKVRKYNEFLLKYFFECLGKSSSEKKYQRAYLSSSQVGVKVA